ncbi:hypothetical protein SAMN05444851_2014 [Aliiroseovarius sediminilitoris]|uniref:Uncharacterized protein n=2 Tax=Aliiroseovarius sediminilitoris TaxID=1173584 RepID=A0A1I0PYD3_9RHOB|nr:hypothetical protein SAMN05444851_2014 [Aliiroseovarius sediminilitoris]
MDMVQELLAEIDEGNTLLATFEDGEYAVWVDYGHKTSTAPYEGVTQDELDAVVKQFPDKVTIRHLAG